MTDPVQTPSRGARRALSGAPCAHAHDHAHAPDAAAAAAERLCADRGLRLTRMRRDVFAALAGATQPLGAYDLIERLADPAGKRPAPITVYRALDFLTASGLAHRIESRNAYVACALDHAHGAGEGGSFGGAAFLICDACGCVSEVQSAALTRDLDGLAAEAGFRPSARVIEVFGRCAHCP